MQQVALLEEKIASWGDQLETFAEKVPQKAQNNGMAEVKSFEETGEGRILPMVIGAAFSGFIGGIVSNFINFGIPGLAPALGGWALRHFGKNNAWLRGIGTGAMIAGLAILLSGFTGGITGALGGGQGQSAGAASGASVVV